MLFYHVMPTIYPYLKGKIALQLRY